MSSLSKLWCKPPPHPPSHVPLLFLSRIRVALGYSVFGSTAMVMMGASAVKAEEAGSEGCSSVPCETLARGLLAEKWEKESQQLFSLGNLVLEAPAWVH